MKRSKHSLSYTKLLSGDMGELLPIGLTEVLPGDSMQHATNILVRCAPMLAPVMHPVEVRIHHWFVPHRLTWDAWEDFITGGPNGTDASVFPTINLTYTAGSPDTGSGIVGQLADYLGCPPKINNLSVSALPVRAYALIYNEWYRDQDLTPLVGFSTASGVDATTNTALQNIAWEKDRFTEARPWEQKGPAITIPLGTSAPVYTMAADGASIGIRSGAAGGTTRTIGTAASEAVKLSTVGGSPMLTDLTAASAVTVGVLREAMALQRYEEARARYGSRYVEYLRYLGVRSSDARLQRPEYLGGGRQMLQFSEVLQTAEGTSPVGEMRGHGIGATRSNRYRRYFEEHGYILSFLSVRPKTIYTQGLPRTWNRRTKEDFYQMELAHIGQEEVQNKEIYAAHASPNGVFGYTDRYGDYREMESSVAGEFRTTILNDWHLGRDFASAPALNDTFVRSVPTKRVFASQTNDVLYIMARHSIQARRNISAVANSFIY
jgi:hypothetical protein